LVGKEFWKRAFDVQFLADEGVIDPWDVNLFATFDTAEEIWAYILDWWQRKGVSVVQK
jgi:predicted Rossmann-fold nucleotide-binding protein